MTRSGKTENPWIERASALLKTPDFWLVLVSVVFYGSLIRTEITYGDGPELLVAMIRFGGAHPSGYPLFTLLGWIVSHIPPAFYMVAFLLSAVPGAFAVWAIYRFLLEFSVSRHVAALTGLAYGASWHVAYQSTRIEVYALHCMLIGFAFVCLAKFFRPRKPIGPAPPPDIRWAYGAVLFVCLALTNHLTSAFMIPATIIGLLLADWRRILKPRTIGIFVGIAASCAAIYLYLPLQAYLNVGDRVSWNDPQTLENFWFHVAGKEYWMFRTTDVSKVASNAEKIWNAVNNTFFPGMLLICIVGAIEWLLRHWRSLVTVLLFTAVTFGYVATYQINDISTYFTGLFIPLVFAFGFGVDWLLKVRFVLDRHPGWLSPLLHLAAVVGMAIWIGNMAWGARPHYYREALAIDMSGWAMDEMQDPAIIFTSVDGHTFPMWYQVYVEQPDRKVAVVDTVMIHLENKQWYRDHLRRSYPWITWPSDEELLGRNWRQKILDRNPDINPYAFLHRRWPEHKSYAKNNGWFFEIVRGAKDKSKYAEKRARHIYMAKQAPVSGVYFHSSWRTYKAGEERIACVVEWWKHAKFVAKWRLKGPNGELYEFNNHEIPADSNLSWEYLLPRQQTPGTWVCEVEAPNNPLLTVEFTIEP